MLRQGVETADEGASENKSEGGAGSIWVKVGDKKVEETGVGKGGKQAAMETRVVTKEAGVAIDAKNGGEELRGQKEK